MKTPIVYISKAIQEKELLNFCTAKNWELIHFPMIRFNEVDFAEPDPASYDIIFFSSSRSVNFFLAKVLPSPQHKLACIGETTAQALKDWGYTADFIGIKSGHPETVSKQFEQFVGEKRVLFPQSNISHQSMQRRLVDDQTINLVVYETFLVPLKLTMKPDILVFTSPSNVRAFLQMNQLDLAQQQIIAWGTTTASYLEQSNIRVDFTLEKSDAQSLIDALDIIVYR